MERTVDDHLHENERILAICDRFYATDQRVIRWESRKIGEQVNTLIYDQIDSVIVSHHRRRRMMAFGGILFLLALAGGANTDGQWILAVIGLVAGSLGVFGVGGTSSFEIRSSDLEPHESNLWRSSGADRKSVLQIAAVIRSGHRSWPFE